MGRRRSEVEGTRDETIRFSFDEPREVTFFAFLGEAVTRESFMRRVKRGNSLLTRVMEVRVLLFRVRVYGSGSRSLAVWPAPAVSPSTLGKVEA